LEQNYPNPFNPTTNVNYSIPTAGFVTLKVYDLLGQEVVTLVNQEQDAGSYRVDFNAVDLANGAYFYRLTAGTFTDVKKMVLMK
ncbi:MAG: T9SS type A sorting domain-containing protein, partial [Bacteroidetes bacterium]|nr:T9SS type A sorting domain-containing protein [Bacteroidota bacterium]